MNAFASLPAQQQSFSQNRGGMQQRSYGRGRGGPNPQHQGGGGFPQQQNQQQQQFGNQNQRPPRQQQQNFGGQQQQQQQNQNFPGQQMQQQPQQQRSYSQQNRKPQFQSQGQSNRQVSQNLSFGMQQQQPSSIGGAGNFGFQQQKPQQQQNQNFGFPGGNMGGAQSSQPNMQVVETQPLFAQHGFNAFNQLAQQQNMQKQGNYQILGMQVNTQGGMQPQQFGGLPQQQFGQNQPGQNAFGALSNFGGGSVQMSNGGMDINMSGLSNSQMSYSQNQTPAQMQQFQQEPQKQQIQQFQPFTQPQQQQPQQQQQPMFQSAMSMQSSVGNGQGGMIQQKNQPSGVNSVGSGLLAEFGFFSLQFGDVYQPNQNVLQTKSEPERTHLSHLPLREQCL
eukprot:403376669